MKRQAVPILQDALKYLDMCRAFTINHDIPIAIRGKSNYLAALGLSVYTEGFGGLYNGSFAQGSSKANYNAFIHNFFPSIYKSVDSRLRADKLGGLYGAIRSALVHEFIMRDSTMVRMRYPNPLNCGIVYNPSGDPKIQFIVTQYFSDLKYAFKNYYNSVKEKPKLVNKLLDALNSINSPLPRSYRLI